MIPIDSVIPSPTKLYASSLVGLKLLSSILITVFYVNNKFTHTLSDKVSIRKNMKSNMKKMNKSETSDTFKWETISSFVYLFLK
jgi:hypothetical protein